MVDKEHTIKIGNQEVTFSGLIFKRWFAVLCVITLIWEVEMIMKNKLVWTAEEKIKEFVDGYKQQQEMK